MTKLTDVQKKLAEQLLLSVKNHEMNVEYNELAARINPPIHWRQVGKNIGEVSKLCHELGLPLLSAKVVNKNTQKAGEGFYPLYAMLGIPTKGKTEKELFHEERDAIRNCKEWYKLEDYLGLNIGFDRPVEEMGFLGLAGDEPLQIPVVKESVIVPPPPEYLKPDVRRFTVSNPTPFHKSVDVLNYGLGIDYLGKIYGGWQKGAFEFTANGTAYMVWFPKLSIDGKPASSSGWINTTADDGRTIIEKASESNHELGYEVADCIRLVFTKTKNEPYYFAGVYLPDKEHSSYQYHVYKRAADVADFTGEVPHILYYKKEDEEDEALIAELKADALTGAPAKYQYAGLAKNKANPVEISGHKVYPRDRQTAINALSHADYRCEINSIHPTFLRRNSSKPYTEPHHLIPMAFSDEFDVSLDVEENIVSLCSNCHNHIHYGQGASELLTKLYHERKEALKCVGIDVSLEELLSFYE